MSDILASPAEVSPRPPRTWRAWWLRMARWHAFLLLVYVLSIGPLFWWWFEAVHVGGSQWLVLFYLPLALASDLIPPFGALLNWYINLWIL